MFLLTPARLRVLATLLVFVCLFPALGAAQSLNGMQCRLFDSRDSATPLVSEQVETIQVTGNCSVPAGATAVIVNVTAVEASQGGWLMVYPASMANPVGPFNASTFPPGSLHFRANDPGRNNTRALNAIVQLSPGGAIKVLPWVASGGTVHVIIDVFGYFGNGPAVANDDVATVAEDSTANAINVLANDSDPEGDAFSVSAVTSPTANGGTVAITGGGTGVEYTPAANFCGTDTFTYTVSGGDTATVTVTVTCADDLADAVDDAATVAEDAAATAIDVLANDTDPEGDAFSVTAVTSPTANGGTVVNGTTNVTYTPATGYCGTDTFTYTITGGDTATVTVTVTCDDDEPVAVNDAATVAEDSTNNAIDVLANDTDTDGGAKSVASAVSPTTQGGTVTVPPGGANVLYTPAANFCGTDTFTYTLTPGSSSATVTVTVTCIDDTSDAVDDMATVAEDSSNNAIDVLANDTDSEGDTLSVTAVSSPTTNGGTVVNGTTNVTYTPAANFCGTDTFTYTITGGDTATVTVTVTCADDAADAVDDAATVAEDSTNNAIDVLANDSDVENDAFSVTAVSSPTANGGTVANGTTNVTYTPAANYCGTDTFTYTITGGDSATVTVTVTCADDDPVAVDDAATVAEDSLNNAIDVLGNDTDVDGGAKAVTAVSSPTANGGTVSNGGSNVSYTPAANFCGTDTFTYTITGGDTATVTVTVTCVDDNPVAVDDAATVTEDSTSNTINVLANDSDAEGDAFSVTAASSPTANGGTVANGGSNVSYTPAANFCGSDSFTYTVTGGDTATVTVTVTCVDDPAVAVDDAATVTEDSTSNTINVLANDSDAEGDAFSVTAASSPTANGGTVANGGSNVSYTPAANFCGSDSFTYTVTGGDTATVTVTVTCVDDPAVAVDDAATVTEDSTSNTINVLANDSDAEGDAFSVTAASSPTANGGTVANGGSNVSYTPAANFCGSDSFTYTVTGGDTATVTVTVTCVDDPAVAVNDATTVTEDVPGTIDVLANDSDAEGDAFSVTAVSSPTANGGTVSNGTTNVTYTPAPNFCGTDSFTYMITGGSSATVTVTVTCVDDPPVAVNDAATVTEDVPNNVIDVLANDTDIDGGPKNVASVSSSSANGGSVTTGGSNVSYTPAANFCGSDSFTYTLNGGSIGTVTVTVTCVNDAPVLGDNNIDYTALGNTQFRVGETTPGTGLLHIRDNDDVDEKAAPSDVDGPGPLTVVPFTGLSANGGNVTLNADGTFTYESAAGFSGTDTFTFTVTDNGAPAQTVNGTVTIAVPQTVWYVHDVVDATHNPAASDTGRSTNAFETLSDVGPVLTNDDYVFIYRGNTGTTPHATGLRITRTGVKVHGEAGGFAVPGFTLVHTTPLSALRPVIANTTDLPAVEDHGIWVDATAASLTGIEIQHLDLSGRDNGIEVTAAGTNNAGVTISNNVVGSSATTGAEAIDVNANSTGTVTVAAINNPSILGRTNGFDARSTAGALRVDFSGNTIQAGATGVNIDGAGGGVVTVTGFSGNVVSGNNGGSGILVNAATFDQVAGGTVQLVSGGTTQVGQTGNGVNGSGVMLTNVQGALSFDRLDIVADNGSGLVASGTGAGFTISDISQLGAIRSAGGPAVNVSSSAMDLRFNNVTVASSGSTGVALTNTSGTFIGASGSSIVNTTGTDFLVDGGNPTVTWAGTITNTAGRAVSLVNRTGNTATLSGAITDTNGLGIELNNNTGTSAAHFTGGLTLSTAANPAFTATSGGTLRVTGSTNTITTTTATALNVANTTIHADGLTFRTISAGTAGGGPSNGIVLNNTGSSAGLTVSGTGSAGSGGTIQRAATGISLTSTRDISLSHMQLNDHTDFAIRGSSVVNFALANTIINGTNGNDAGADEGSVRFTELTGSASVTNCNISGAVENNFTVVNTSGTLNRITFTSTTFGANSTATGDDGLLIEGQNAAVVNATVQSGTFTSTRGDHFQLNLIGTASSDLVFTGNTITNAHPAVVSGGGGIRLTGGGAGSNPTATYNISNNILRDSNGTAIGVTKGAGTGTFTGTIDNNQIGVAGVTNSGSSGGSGISVILAENGTHTTTVTNNQIRQYNNFGIIVQAGGTATVGSGTLKATVTGNTISNPGTMVFAKNGFQLNSGTLPGETYQVCLTFGGAGALRNSLVGSGTDGGTDFRLRQRQATTVRLPGYAGANNDDAAVVTFAQGNNNLGGTPTGSATNTVPTGGGWIGGTCP